MKFNTALIFALGTFLVSPLSLTSAANSAKGEFDVNKAAKEIDALVEAGLRKHDLKPNAEIKDETFVRRAYLDIAGRIPTIEESENFLGSTYERKRERLITNLLESDGHVSHSYNFWADVLRINNQLGSNAIQAEAAYQLWIKDSVKNNRPYDEMVSELVSATGMIWDNGAVGYYQRDRGMPLDNMSNTVRIFLGTRLECAQCHNHPFDKWTQMDYFKMAAFSYGMDARGYSSENRSAYNMVRRERRTDRHHAMLEKAGYKDAPFPEITNQASLEKYTENKKYQNTLKRLKMTDKEFRNVAKKSMDFHEDSQKQSKAIQYGMLRMGQRLRYYSTDEKVKDLELPHDYQYDDAKPNDVVSSGTMFGADIDLENMDESSIHSYAKWLTSPDNPTFTKVIANRLWKRVFGHGVFEPVDDLTDQTHVENPELLEYITKLMRDVNYDTRAYMEVLYNTRTYQSAVSNGEMVMGMPYHFPGPVFRRMTAEQLWDSIVALALPEADSYRPRLKSQLSSIERYRKMYIALEEQPAEDYIAMVDELGEQIRDMVLRREKLTEQMYVAREAKNETKYSKLNDQLKQIGREESSTVLELAFKHVGKNVDPDALLAAVGMSEMSISGGAVMAGEGMSKGDDVVLTKLPKVAMKQYEMPEPPEGLDSGQMKKWRKSQSDAAKRFKSAQAAEMRNYTKLVAEMARASELQSPAPRGHFLREFGQSDREVIENAAGHASIPQALNLLNGSIVEALTNQYAVFGSRVHEAGTPEEKTRMIFQAMLTREPTENEMTIALGELDAHGDSAYEGIVWALLNTRQFIFVQ